MSETTLPDFAANAAYAKAGFSRAATAYEHCARLIEGRMAISSRVDGDAAGAVNRALEPIAQQLRQCAQAMTDRKPIAQIIAEAAGGGEDD